jgi:hypothetical protein
MGLLNHFRSRSKVTAEEEKLNGHYNYTVLPVAGADYTAKLPPKVLKRIFEFVCPHTLDKSYEPQENVNVGETCMLCGLRDLAHCAAVRRSWYHPAQELL